MCYLFTCYWEWGSNPRSQWLPEISPVFSVKHIRTWVWPLRPLGHPSVVRVSHQINISTWDRSPHNDARTAVNCDTSPVNSGRVRMGYLGSRVTNWPIGNHFFSFRVHRPPSHGPWQLKSGITSNVCCPFPRHRRRSCSLKGDDKEKNRKHVITQYSFFSKDDDLGDERARSHKGKALLGLTWLQAATKKVKHWWVRHTPSFRKNSKRSKLLFQFQERSWSESSEVARFGGHSRLWFLELCVLWFGNNLRLDFYLPGEHETVMRRCAHHFNRIS